MILDPYLLALLVMGVLLTGISKSGFAGGVGVVAVPLISLQASPAFAVAIMLPLLIMMDVLSLRVWWRHRVDGLLLLMLPAAVLGIGVGYLAYGRWDDELLKTMLGVFSIVFALWGLLKPFRGYLLPRCLGTLCGGISGFTSFIAHAGGPPLNFYLLQERLTKEQFLGTAVVFLAAINLVKLVPYGLLGLLVVDNLLVTLALVPVAWLGVRLGLVIQRHLDSDRFFRVILLLLLVLGVRLIIDGRGWLN